MEKLYSAVVNGRNTVNVFDVKTGVKSYSLSLGDVDIVNGPVITQDKMTIVVKTKEGTMTGRVYTLPKAVLSYSFAIK